MIVTRPEYAFVNHKGWIKNLVLVTGTPEYDVDIGGVELIRTLKGEVRANHWHKRDWHYLYVLEGSILYTYWPLGSLFVDAPKVTVPEGCMVFTPPRECHLVEALEDTVMISVSHLPRDHETHEQDVVRL
jgi:quercetin dioxygenase-like cupin family protein